MSSSGIKKIVLLILLLLIAAFLVFNDSGVIKYMNLRSELSNLENQINSTETEIEQLKMEIDSLKHNMYKIEKVARERYHMLGKNEQALKVEEKKKYE